MLVEIAIPTGPCSDVSRLRHDPFPLEKLPARLWHAFSNPYFSSLSPPPPPLLLKHLTCASNTNTGPRNHAHQIRRLERERDEMRKQVLSLAETNYAREPEFVRDRLRLREQSEELARMLRQLESKHMEPILVQLNAVQAKLARDAMKHEEQSETMAHQFLVGACAGPAEGADGGHGCAEGADPTSSGGSCEQFLRDYVELRGETIKRRILADRLAKERDALLSNITYKSLSIAGKQRHGTTASETASIISADSAITCTTGANTSSATDEARSASPLSTTLPAGSTDSPKPTPRQKKRVSFNR